MATFSVTFSNDTLVVPGNAKKDFVVIAHEKEFYSNLTTLSPFSEIAQLSEAELELIQHVALSNLHPNADNITATELTFKVEDPSKPTTRKIVLAVLPNGASRHNTITRSHSIHSLLKSYANISSNLMVYLIPKDLHHSLAQSCAVARAFPTFTKKTSKSTIPSSFQIIIEPPFNILNVKSFINEIESVIGGIRLVSCMQMTSIH